MDNEELDEHLVVEADFARLMSMHGDESCWLCPEIDRERRTHIKGVDIQRTSEFIASTSKEARDGDIIDQQSWRLANYRRNPVILKDHYGEVVGRSLKTWVADNELRSIVDWDDSPVNKAGELIAHQHRSGFRKAVSVRWRAGKLVRRDKLDKADPFFSEGRTIQGLFGKFQRVGFLHKNSELREISSVGVPSDPFALQTRAAGAALEEIDDPGLARSFEEQFAGILADGRIFKGDGFRAEVRDLLLYFIRTDRDIQTAARALGLTAPTPERDTPLGPPSGLNTEAASAWPTLDFLFPTE